MFCLDLNEALGNDFIELLFSLVCLALNCEQFTSEFTILNSNTMPSSSVSPPTFLPSHRSILHFNPHILMTSFSAYAISGCWQAWIQKLTLFSGRLRSTHSHVLGAAWQELLDGCEIGWTAKPGWMRPEPFTSVMVLCSDMAIVWFGLAFEVASYE